MEVKVIEFNSVEMAKKKGKKNVDKREDNFPQFPTDVDIMIRVVGKNVGRILSTCNKGNGTTLFRFIDFQYSISNIPCKQASSCCRCLFSVQVFICVALSHVCFRSVSSVCGSSVLHVGYSFVSLHVLISLYITFQPHIKCKYNSKTPPKGNSITTLVYFTLGFFQTNHQV